MPFNQLTTSYTLMDFVGRVSRGELKVNKDYQRTDEVWPDSARSFLIESILLGFPIPKLTIRELTDLKTKTLVGEIVDGQQRTRAICDFFHEKFAISRKSEVESARNCKFSALPDHLQQSFVSYKLQADILSGAKDEDIIDLFRRINSNTVSLNPEEQRHAGYQGAMKWFVHGVARQHGETLNRLRVISLKQRARMQDTKLFAEIIHAILNGISTTNAKSLNALYGSHNGKSFAESEEISSRFNSAFAYLNKLEGLEGSSLSRPYHYYALILAIMHAKKEIPKLGIPGGAGLRPADDASSRLEKLADALDADDEESVAKNLRPFYRASDATTNTAANRTIRFKAYLKAVSLGS